MRIVEETSLKDFYRAYLPIVRSQGFKLVILALIREADVPRFYADLKRYWQSLDSVTGKDVLFALAGRDVSCQFNEAGVVRDREGYERFTMDIALALRANSRDLAVFAPSELRKLANETHRVLRQRLERVGETNTSQVTQSLRHLAEWCLHEGLPPITSLAVAEDMQTATWE